MFLRDAVNDLALHFLAKMKILVVREIEREDIEFISRVRCTVSIVLNSVTLTSFQTLGCRPVASLDHFLPEHLGFSQLVEEVSTGTSKVVKVLIIMTNILSLNFKKGPSPHKIILVTCYSAGKH